MKKTIIVILLVLASLMVLCNLMAGCVSVIPKGFVDFPCFADYDAANQCVSVYGPLPGEGGGAERIQVFLTAQKLGWKGGACSYRVSETDSLYFETPGIDLTFQRSGETLLVNGEPLNVGDEFSFTNYTNIPPWSVDTIRFVNYGLTGMCGSEAEPRIIVIGRYGESVSVIKALVTILPWGGAVALFAVLLSRERRKRKSQAEAGG